MDSTIAFATERIRAPDLKFSGREIGSKLRSPCRGK
jgi:hypothetical protein